MNKSDRAYDFLKSRLDSYSPLSVATWESFKNICKLKRLSTKGVLYQMGDIPESFAFVVKGLIRCFISNLEGNEYNKNFFLEGDFPGSMVSLLTNTPSEVQFEAIEDSLIIEIDFQKFRQLLGVNKELMLFHIHYLEKNWLLAKDAREIRLVQEEAKERYKALQTERPELLGRLPLFHIASHLGITPTQLSRIRREKSKENEK